MKILLATDGSEHSRAAAALVARLTWPPGSGIIVIAVAERHALLDPDGPIESSEEREQADQIRNATDRAASELAEAEAEALRATGLEVQALVRRGLASDQILDATDEFAPDLLVLGARGQSQSALFRTGRVARKLLRHAPCSVLIARLPREPEPDHERLRILLGFDATLAARAAVTRLAGLPLGDEAEITALTVLSVGSTLFRQDIIQRMSEAWQQHVRDAETALDQVAAALRAATPHVSTRLLQGGSESTQEILDAGRLLGSDLIVLGDTGKRGARAVLLGSVSSQVSEYADCSVWVVRE